jgi:hypothetical protein
VALQLEPVEARIMVVVALMLLAVGVLAALVPRLLAYPVSAVALWVGGAPLYRGYRLFRRPLRRSIARGLSGRYAELRPTERRAS